MRKLSSFLVPKVDRTPLFMAFRASLHLSDNALSERFPTRLIGRSTATQHIPCRFFQRMAKFVYGQAITVWAYFFRNMTKSSSKHNYLAHNSSAQDMLTDAGLSSAARDVRCLNCGLRKAIIAQGFRQARCGDGDLPGCFHRVI